ncbi:MAG: hypothetical protein JNK29_19570 [Anaerolineales bacterium]|nr:hypothetical protein [Anaerolineales bacterium]
MSDPAADRALLRRFEPVIRYTRGERFFPLDVAAYVQECSLWVQRPGAEPECLTPEGELTLGNLAEPHAHGFGAVYFLKFIEPFNIRQLAEHALKERLGHRAEAFHAGRGRLARVGYSSRFVDALFSLTLFARGRVPGDAATAAAVTYRRLMAADERYCYAGRVVRRDDWLVLQYWFFYPFNNWRSGYFGVNDHEADWEMITLYASEPSPGQVLPEWVAYSSHDFAGDDLRRRWDDPEVEKLGEHPVIYAGAGSHASYYQRGEYLAELELPFLAPLARLADRARYLWRQFVGGVSGTAAPAEPPVFNVFRVPFVDYARGDGLALGPGQERGWAEPHLLEPAPAWVTGYRGLWGLYARDPIAGENAPAGPAFNRDGTLRRAWHDPLGWAGLDKVPPAHLAALWAGERQAEIEVRAEARQAEIAAKRHALIDLQVEARAMEGQPHLQALHTDRLREIEALAQALAELKRQAAADQDLREALRRHVADLAHGDLGPLRAHIRHAHRPASDTGLALGRAAEAWSAVSIGLLMIGLVLVALFARHYLVFGLTSLLTAILFVEAGFRRQLPRLVASLTLALAVVCALILLFEFFWEIVVGAVLAASAYIMWENLRELRG